MSIFIPPKADPDLLRCLRDIEQQLNELNSAPGPTAPVPDSGLLSRLETVESRLNGLSQFERVSQPFADYKNDGNPSRVLHEDGTWVEPLAGIAKAVPPSLDSSRTRPTNLVNLLGSLAVTGAVSADTVRCRLFKTRPVGVHAYNSVNITTNTGTTLVTFDSESYDTDSFHSTSTNTGRLTIPTGLDGWYVIKGEVQWAANTNVGRRILTINRNANGADADSTRIGVVGLPNVSDNTVGGMQISAFAFLVGGDYIELSAITSHDTSIAAASRVYSSPSLAMLRVSGL